MMKSRLNGIQYLINGFKLIQQPGLKRYALIPLLINMILFAGLFMYSRHVFGELSLWLLALLPAWLQWIGSILWVLFFIGFFFLMIYTFVTLANLIAAPFNSLLAEKVEYHLTGVERDNQTFLQAVQDTPRIVLRQLALLGYYLPRAAVLIILFFIPVVQLIAPILWFLFHAWLMTLQYVDYPTDNQRIAIKDVQMKLNKKRVLCYTFGSGVMILSMIPIVNFFVMPAAVAGATRMWIEELA